MLSEHGFQIGSRQDIHNNCVSVNVLISHHFLLWTLFCHRPFQDKAKLPVLNFGWLLNEGKDNRKPSAGQPKGGQLVGALSALGG